MVREELAPRGFWGRVQGVGLMGWVNTRPMVCDTPSARSADAREARFIGELSLIYYRSIYIVDRIVDSTIQFLSKTFV